MTNIIADKLIGPTRLDKFLTQKLEGYSRSALQQAIKRGEITLNGKTTTVHHFLKNGDIIEVSMATAAPKHVETPTKTINVIQATPDYIIVNKPAGIIVHPAPGIKDKTLIEILVEQYPEIEAVGNDKTRPGIVHRLDREVSGVMAVARTNEMFECLKKQFQNRTIEKIYSALVVGRMAQPSGTIRFPLARSSGKHGKMAARPQQAEDTREAITHFTVEKYFSHATLLSVKLETGRTHQIRAHLAAMSHSIVGDNLYRPKKLHYKSTPGRLFLHAQSLTFINLSGTPQTFASPLPEELKKFLLKLI